MKNIEQEIIAAATKHSKQFDSDYQDQSYSDFYEGAEWGVQRGKWIDINSVNPQDGNVYDIVIFWPETGKQEKRENYNFVASSNLEKKPMFQETAYFLMGLYEMTFFLEEGLITHYREHMELPKKL